MFVISGAAVVHHSADCGNTPVPAYWYISILFTGVNQRHRQEEDNFKARNYN